MKKRATAKRNALGALRGKWAQACSITLIPFAITAMFALCEQLLYLLFGVKSAPSSFALTAQTAPVLFKALFITCLVGAFSYLILQPLQLGCQRWYFKTVSACDDAPCSILRFFQSPRLWCKSLWLGIVITVKTMLYIVLCLLPAATVLLISAPTVALPMYLSPLRFLLLALALILALAGVVFAIFVTRKYFLAPYLLIQTPTMKVHVAIKQSAVYMKDKRSEIFALMLSFLPSYLALFFIFPGLFVLPYLNSTYALYAKIYLTQFVQTVSNDTNLTQPQPKKEQL